MASIELHEYHFMRRSAFYEMTCELPDGTSLSSKVPSSCSAGVDNIYIGCNTDVRITRPI